MPTWRWRSTAPDNLASDGGEFLFSSGGDVLALPLGEDAPVRVAQRPATVTALAAGPGRSLAIAGDDGTIFIHGGAHAGKSLAPTLFNNLACPTALAFESADSLLIAQGSSRHRASDWAVDLMEKNARGSLWRIDLAKMTTQRLVGELAFPYGILIQPQRIVVSESWRHRLVAVPREGGTAQPLLTKLPGYPARLSPASDGGAWLALFAPRNRLIEFVLLEDDYRSAMMTRDRSGRTGSRRRLPPARASWSRCRAAGSRPWACTSRGRRAAPTAWWCGWMPTCGRSRASTAVPTEGGMASPAWSKPTAG